MTAKTAPVAGPATPGQILGLLTDRGFTPGENFDVDVFTLANVRVVIDGTDIMIYVFGMTAHGIARWDTRLRAAPIAAIAAVLGSAMPPPRAVITAGTCPRCGENGQSPPRCARSGYVSGSSDGEG